MHVKNITKYNIFKLSTLVQVECSKYQTAHIILYYKIETIQLTIWHAKQDIETVP